MSGDQASPGESTILLSSLAILSVDATHQRSYLDHFVPFAIQALSMLGGTGNLTKISGSVDAEFGFIIEPIVIKEILKRADAHHFVTKVHENYTVTDKGIAVSTKFDEKRNKALAEQYAYIMELIQFVKKRHSISWTHEQGEAALEHFIINMSVGSIIELLTKKLERENLKLDQDDPQGTYLVSDFVFTSYVADPGSIVTLENLVKGSMLAFAIFLPIPIDQSRKFRNTTLWIDTPIALQWLGLEGEENALYIQNAIALAEKQGVQIGIFSHTVSEMRSIVLSAATDKYNPTSLRARPVAKYCAEKSYSVIEIAEIASNLENELVKLNVFVSHTPRIEVHTAVDEAALEKAIADRIPYHHTGSLIKDVNSLSAVSRLRNGHVSRQMEDCKALFVTDNYNLVRVANAFFEASKESFGVAITLEDLSWMLWIKDPISEVNLPRHRIIADVISILDPSDELWESYLDELDRLALKEPITVEALAVFRSSEIMGNMLMESTVGDVRNVSRRSVEKLLVTFSSSITQEKQNEFEEKLRLERERYQHQSQELAPLLGRLEQFEVFKQNIIRKCERDAKIISGTIITLLLIPLTLEAISLVISVAQASGFQLHMTAYRWILIGLYSVAALAFKIWKDFRGYSTKEAHGFLSGTFQKWLQDQRIPQKGFSEPT